MTDFVLDTSVLLAILLPDEQTGAVLDIEKALHGDGSKIFVPVIWSAEVANALKMAEKRRRISHAQRTGLMQQAAKLPVAVDYETVAAVWHAADELAETYGLTHYDATYLEIAMRRKISLATLDAALRAAAKKAKVRVLPK